jgi:CheY-like chemotaxis protein
VGKARPSNHSSASPAGSNATGSTAAAHRTLDILVLEDDDSTRNVLDALLGGLGHRVIGSKSVKEAKALLGVFVFDLLLCDLSLPDGSGLEIASHIPPDHKVYKIIVSGYGEPEDIARSKAAGFDAHLVKPIDVGLLQREVWRLTGQPL